MKVKNMENSVFVFKVPKKGQNYQKIFVDKISVDDFRHYFGP